MSWNSNVVVKKPFWKSLFAKVKLSLHWNYCVHFCCSWFSEEKKSSRFL